MDQDRKKVRLFKLATESYRASDGKLWVSALACAGVVGNYDRGATMGLADDMGVSTDTIEDLAHAYSIYRDLCEMDGGEYRKFVRNARKSPYVYYSHFRALWDAKSQYKLHNAQLISLLLDIVQAEGGISSRGVDGATRGRFGDTRGFEFYAGRAYKELSQTIQQPDLPNTPEEVGNAYAVTWLVEGKKHSTIVIAANPQRAQNIAKKKLSETVDAKLLKNDNVTIRPMGAAVTDSKNLLTITHSWLGDQ